MERYPIPARVTQAEHVAGNSKFIATISPAFSVQHAREFMSQIKTDFHDASHHVPAFIIGHGSSMTSHCSDDGEPSGTAGPPVLAVLQGSGLGDACIVVTRYFGGQKLGTGGLVRAYGDSARSVLSILPRAIRVPTHTVMIAMSYSQFESVKRLVSDHQGKIIEQEFMTDVTVTALIDVEDYVQFQVALRELSNGTLESLIIDTKDEIVTIN